MLFVAPGAESIWAQRLKDLVRTCIFAVKGAKKGFLAASIKEIGGKNMREKEAVGLVEWLSWLGREHYLSPVARDALKCGIRYYQRFAE